MQGHVFRQGNRQVKAEGEVRVAFLKTVNLLFRLAAALGQQHFAGLNDRGVQRGKAIKAVSFPENLHDPLHLPLRGGEELHKAGEGTGSFNCHNAAPFLSP